MEEEESSLVFFESDESDDRLLEECDVMKINSILSKLNLFNGEKFEWDEITNGNEVLEIVVNGLKAILHADTFKKFSKENLNDILEIIKGIISEAISQKQGFVKKHNRNKLVSFQNSPVYRNRSSASLPFEPEEPEHADTAIKSLQKEIIGLRKQLADKNEEIQVLINETTTLGRKHSVEQLNNNTKIQKLIYDIERKDEKIILLNDKIKIKDSSLVRLETEFDQQAKENASIRAENSTYKHQLETKESQIEKYKMKINDLLIETHSLNDQNAKLMAIANEYKARYHQTSINIPQKKSDYGERLAKENTSLHRSIASLFGLYKKESDELSSLRIQADKLKDLIRKQVMLINLYDGELQKTMRIRNKLVLKLNSKNAQKINSEKIESVSNQLNDFYKILRENKAEFRSHNEALKAFNKIINNIHHVEDMNHNLSLLSSALVRFNASLVHTGKIDPRLILPNSEAKETNDAKNEIISAFESATQFLAKNSFENFEFTESMEKAISIVSNNLDLNKEEGIVISSQSRIISVLRRFNENTEKSNRVLSRIISKICSNLKYEGPKKDLPDYILKTIENLEEIVNELKAHLLPCFEFSGPLKDLPAHVADYVKYEDDYKEKVFEYKEREKKLNEEVAKLKVMMIEGNDSYEYHMKTLKEENADLKTNLEKKQNDAIEMEKLKEEIDEIKNEYDKIKREKEITVEELKKTQNNLSEIIKQNNDYGEINNQLEMQVKENLELRNQNEKMKKENEEKIKVLESSKKSEIDLLTMQNLNELQRIRNSARAREEELISENKKLSKQLSSYKLQQKEIISQYEEKFQSQKNTVDVYKNLYNNILEKSLQQTDADLNENTGGTSGLDLAIAEISELKKNNENLIETLQKEHLKQLQDRDSYWISKIEKIDTEMQNLKFNNKSLTLENQALKENLKSREDNLTSKELAPTSKELFLLPTDTEYEKKLKNLRSQKMILQKFVLTNNHPHVDLKFENLIILGMAIARLCRIK